VGAFEYIKYAGLVHMYRKYVDDGSDDHHEKQWQVKDVP